MAESVATRNENPNIIPRSGIVLVIVLMLAPGCMFLAKGAVEIIDRYTPRATSEATITDATEGTALVNKRLQPVYTVNGLMSTGKPFAFNDVRVFELVQGNTPLPVLVERTVLSDRVVAVVIGDTRVDQVGGATALWLGLLGIIVGLALAAVPFLFPWQTEARKRARKEGTVLPRPDLGGLAMISLAAIAIISGSVAWDLLR